MLVDSKKPLDLLKEPNRFFFLFVGSVLGVVLLLILLIGGVRRHRHRKAFRDARH